MIREQLHDEDERKESFERRGITVITTSAALASLLYGLTSVISSAPHTGIPTWARYFLYGALFFFGAAAVAAILTNVPLRYRGIKTDRLRELVEREEWEKPAPPAERGAAKARLVVLKAARAANNLKGIALLVAVIAEVVAVICVAVSVAIIVTGPLATPTASPTASASATARSSP